MKNTQNNILIYYIKKVSIPKNSMETVKIQLYVQTV